MPAASCCSGERADAIATPVPPVGQPGPVGPSGRQPEPTSNCACSRMARSDPVEAIVQAVTPAEKSATYPSVPPADTAATPLSLTSARTYSPASTVSGRSRVTVHSCEYAPPRPHMKLQNHQAVHDGP